MLHRGLGGIGKSKLMQEQLYQPQQLPDNFY